MSENRYPLAGTALLFAATAILLAPFLHVPLINQSQAEFLLSAAPLLSLLAARALHARWTNAAPETADRLLTFARILLGVVVALFVYGTVANIVFAAPAPPLIGLLWMLTVVGFITWTVAAARLSLQTGTLHPVLCAIGLLAAAGYAGMLLLLFATPGGLITNIAVTTWLGSSLFWLLGLALVAFRVPPNSNTGALA